VALQINHPWVDERREPLYVVMMEDCDEAGAQAFYDCCERFYATLDRDIAWVLDTTRVTRVTAKQRRIAADHVARVRDKMRERVVGVAFVISNPLIRGTLTAIAWLIPLPFPYETFKTHEEAISWAERRLRARLEAGRDARPQA
jgi:hypothetical protein